MALVIEDGAGSNPAANSYVSVADFAQWLADMAYDIIPADKQEGYLRRAIGEMELLKWIGAKASATQPLQWPRADVVLPDGQVLPSDSIPSRIVTGQQQLAREIYARDQAGGLDAGASGRLTGVTKRVEGAVTVTKTYDNTGKLMFPATTDGSQSQFADFVYRRGLFAIRA